MTFLRPSRPLKVSIACARRASITASIALLIVTAFASQANAQEATKTWNYSGNYTADIMSVASGGVGSGTRYIDNLGLQVRYDGTAHGLNGISATFGLLYNNKASIAELTGDVQGISNIETGTAALRPYETWIAKTWGADAAMLKAGLIDLNGTFDAPGVSALFLNPSHGINASFAQTGANGPSIFPILGLAVVGQAKLTDGLTIRAGAFDGVPGDPDKPERTDLAWRKSDGALLLSEAELSLGQLRFVAGAWGYTQTSTPLFFSDSAQNNVGIYGTGEYAHSDAISYFVRAGHTNAKLNFVENYLAAGAVWTGPFAARKDDQFGIAIAHARVSPRVVNAGITKEAETNVELTYAAPLTDYVTLQGDVQYVANPAGGLVVDNALVVGLRVRFGFGG
jgi:porin